MDMLPKNKKNCYIFCPNPAFDVKATIEGFVPGLPTRIISEERFPGGKGVHVALVLSELGIIPELIGIWGKQNRAGFEEACQHFYSELKMDGLDVEGYIRTCYTFLAENEWKDTELLGSGPSITNEHIIELEKWITRHASAMDYFAICGSWPKGAPEDATARMVKTCQKYGIKTIVDASGVQLINALKAHPHLIHLNKNELNQLIQSGLINEPQELLNYTDFAAITYGKDGLTLLNEKESWKANVILKEPVISSVGSGDALTAGIIKAMMEGGSVSNMAKMGVACGAANCLRKELGLLHLDQVNALLEEVETLQIEKSYAHD
jgi:1-phosphofructokinase family hexose kinase